MSLRRIHKPYSLVACYQNNIWQAVMQHSLRHSELQRYYKIMTFWVMKETEILRS